MKTNLFVLLISLILGCVSIQAHADQTSCPKQIELTVGQYGGQLASGGYTLYGVRHVSPPVVLQNNVASLAVLNQPQYDLEIEVPVHYGVHEGQKLTLTFVSENSADQSASCTYKSSGKNPVNIIVTTV